MSRSRSEFGVLWHHLCAAIAVCVRLNCWSLFNLDFDSRFLGNDGLDREKPMNVLAICELELVFPLPLPNAKANTQLWSFRVFALQVTVRLFRCRCVVGNSLGRSLEMLQTCFPGRTFLLVAAVCLSFYFRCRQG